MKAPDIILRCYLKSEHGQFVAVCIDLCLAAQADTAQEARAKLSAQITDYVEEAVTIDKAFAAQLLRRRAPLGQRLTYHAINIANSILVLKDHMGRLGLPFKTVLPIHVGSHCHA